MASLRSMYTQLYPPPAPLTEHNLPSQAGKILYAKGAKVYMASRSREKAEEAMKEIYSSETGAKGEIVFLELDLSDLESVKKAAVMFQGREERLDVLWNNAGVAQMPTGSKSKQGYEPAKQYLAAGVRIIFTSSGVVDAVAPKGGIDLAMLSTPPIDPNLNYSLSKTGNWFLASEFAALLKKDGIVSITLNPGNLSTAGWIRAPKWAQLVFKWINHPPVFGAYTNLWAGFSEEISLEDGGRYGIPWGRWHPKLRKDIVEALKTKEDGGTGQADAFWKWCEEQPKPYA